MGDEPEDEGAFIDQARDRIVALARELVERDNLTLEQVM